MPWKECHVMDERLRFVARLATGPVRCLRDALQPGAAPSGVGMKVPADVYARSTRVYRGLEELTYPFHDATFTVTHCGRICFKGRKVNLSHVFAGQNVGVTQVGERIWLVTFMQYDLGYFDDETCRLEPIENPFGPKVLPMCSE
jgi:putative transposase